MIYVSGVIGVEAVSGWHFEVFGKHNLGYNLLVTLEEGLEMLGVVVFIYALTCLYGGSICKYHVQAQ